MEATLSCGDGACESLDYAARYRPRPQRSSLTHTAMKRRGPPSHSMAGPGLKKLIDAAPPPARRAMRQRCETGCERHSDGAQEMCALRQAEAIPAPRHAGDAPITAARFHHAQRITAGRPPCIAGSKAARLRARMRANGVKMGPASKMR